MLTVQPVQLSISVIAIGLSMILLCWQVYEVWPVKRGTDKKLPTDRAAIRILTVFVATFVIAYALPNIIEEADWAAGTNEKLDRLTDLTSGRLGVVDRLFEPELYSKDDITDGSITRLRVFVPVGLVGVYPTGQDAKVDWIAAIQDHLRADKKFQFHAVYGLPDPKAANFQRVACLLARFSESPRADVRVFKAPRISEGDEFAPGVGVLLADRPKGNLVLFGAATLTNTPRIDQAVTIVWPDAYEVFDAWFSEHVRGSGDTGIGEPLPLRKGLEAALATILDVAEAGPNLRVTCDDTP